MSQLGRQTIDCGDQRRAEEKHSLLMTRGKGERRNVLVDNSFHKYPVRGRNE